MKGGRAQRRLGVVACVLAATGCHTYRPVELTGIRRGARVRVVASRPVPVRLREVTIEQATSMDAEAVAVENGNLVLSAFWVGRAGGAGTPAEGWTVTVPVDAVASVSEKRFSWWRSALVTGAVVLGTAFGWNQFGTGASGGEDGGDGGGEPL